MPGIAREFGNKKAARRMAAAILGVLALSLAQLPPAAAQDDQSLEKAQENLAKERAKAEELQRKDQGLREEIQALRVYLVGAARKAQDQESELLTIEARLTELEAQESDKVAALQSHDAQLRRTLGALQRIALQPPEALVAAPGSPIDTVRSAMLLRVAIPTIETRAAALAEELSELESLRDQIALKKHELATLVPELEEERQRITGLIERKQALRSANSKEQQAAQRRAEKWAKEAANLRDLMAQVERESKAQAERQGPGRARCQGRSRTGRKGRGTAWPQNLKMTRRRHRNPTRIRPASRSPACKSPRKSGHFPVRRAR